MEYSNSEREKVYSNIFQDHMKIAKQKFIEENRREPNIYEQIERYRKLTECFYE